MLTELASGLAHTLHQNFGDELPRLLDAEEEFTARLENLMDDGHDRAAACRLVLKDRQLRARLIVESNVLRFVEELNETVC